MSHTQTERCLLVSGSMPLGNAIATLSFRVMNRSILYVSHVQQQCEGHQDPRLKGHQDPNLVKDHQGPNLVKGHQDLAARASRTRISLVL